MLELFASDTTELAGVYDALAGRGGPLQDRAFVQEQVVAAAGREQAGTASYDPFAGNDGAQAFGRGWAQICAQPRNIAFVLLGAAVAFAALYAEASTFTEDSNGATSTCSWDPDRGTLEASLAGPVVGSALVFLGLRRSEPGAVRTVAAVGAVVVILASLLIPAARLLSSQVGIFLRVLGPGEPMAMYHWEADQEDFLVLSGEALLIVEGEERPLRQWDFFHCPAGTRHIIVGAGDGPCVVLAVGAREHQGGAGWGGYAVDETALRHGAGVAEETTDAAQAYAGFPRRELLPYREGWLPALAHTS